MRLVYVSESVLPSATANSVHVMRMCDALTEIGQAVTLVASIDGKTSIEDIHRYYGTAQTFAIINVSRRFGRGGVYSYAVRASFRAARLSPDLVWSRSLAAGALLAICGFPVLLECHEPPRNAGPIIEQMFRLAIRLKNTRKLLVVTLALKKKLQKIYGIEDARILVAPDGARLPRTEHVREKTTNDSLGSFKVGYTGSLYKGRGIELIAELSRRCRWAEFHVVGGDPSSVEQWRQRTAGNRNLYFHGYRKPAETEKILDEFDVLIAPYQGNVQVAGNMGNNADWMSPLKIFEYMAAGKPIVCTDLPVLREVLRHGENALLAAGDDAEAWVEALERLTRDASLRQSLANRAYDEFVSLYTWSARARQVLSSVSEEIEKVGAGARVD